MFAFHNIRRHRKDKIVASRFEDGKVFEFIFGIKPDMYVVDIIEMNC